jgi:hypothetical protein
MCDYSLEGFRTRAAKPGDRLIISRYLHGFMRLSDKRRLDRSIDKHGSVAAELVCLTCLNPGARLDLQLYERIFYDVEFIQLEANDYRDYILIQGALQLCVAALPVGTIAQVLPVKVNTAPGMELVRRVINRTIMTC